MPVSTVTPRTAPTTPDTARGKNRRQLTFLWAMCEVAVAAVVNTSAAWMLADAAAGGTPKAISTEEEMTP